MSTAAEKAAAEKKKADQAAADKFLADSAASGGGLYGLGERGKKRVAGAYDVVQGTSTGHPLTVDETLTNFLRLYKTDPAAYAAIQSLMFQAGSYYSTDYHLVPGRADAETFAAFKEVVLGASGSNDATGGDGVSLYDFLKRNAELGQTLGTTTKQRVPFVAHPTDPLELRKVVNAGATALYGKGADPQLVNDIVASYRALQVSRQQQDHELQYGKSGTEYDSGTQAPVGPGGVVSPAPDQAAYVEDKLRKADPAQAGATDVANATHKFLDIINQGAPKLAQF